MTDDSLHASRGSSGPAPFIVPTCGKYTRVRTAPKARLVNIMAAKIAAKVLFMFIVFIFTSNPFFDDCEIVL